MPDHHGTRPCTQHAPSLHRRRRDTGQHRLPLAPPIAGAPLHAFVHDATPHEQPLDAPVDHLDQAVHLFVDRRRGGEKAQPASAVLHIDTVEHERMDVDVQIGAAPKRWMTATAPPRPPSAPACRARRRSEPSTARTKTPATARHNA